MKAVVTGGAGFIGSHMTELLLNCGYQVVVIDDLSVGTTKNLDHLKGFPKLELVEKNILNSHEFISKFKGADCVFHFAGIGDIVPSINEPLRYCETNISGTINVLEACRQANVGQFIYAASSSCYGIAETPTSEDAPIDLQHPYAMSKYLGEQAALNWGKFYRFRVNSIRIFNAYGLRSKTTGAYGAVMGVFLRQKIEGVPFTVVGDGTQARDFLNVKDLVKAFHMVSQSSCGLEVFNVGSGSPNSINHLVSLLNGPVINIPWRPGEPNCTWANISKIQHLTGWQPEIDFEAGVAELLENISYWSEAPLWNTENIKLATDQWFKFLG